MTLARSISDSFAGIRPADVPGFVGAQFLGAIAATILFRWLVPITTEAAETVIIPHAPPHSAFTNLLRTRRPKARAIINRG